MTATHTLQERFQAHPMSGPDFQILWKGSVYVRVSVQFLVLYSQPSSGGKSGARTIQVDDDWRKLCEDLRRQPRVMDVSVYLDGELLSPRFERIQLVRKFPSVLDIFNVCLCRVCSHTKWTRMKRFFLVPRYASYL